MAADSPPSGAVPARRFKPDIRLVLVGLLLLVVIIASVRGGRDDSARGADPGATVVASGTVVPGADLSGQPAQTLGLSGAAAATALPTPPTEMQLILFHDPYAQGFIGTCTTPIRPMEALPTTSMYVRVDCDYDGQPDVWAYTTDVGVPEALMAQLMEAAQR